MCKLGSKRDGNRVFKKENIKHESERTGVGGLVYFRGLYWLVELVGIHLERESMGHHKWWKGVFNLGIYKRIESYSMEFDYKEIFSLYDLTDHHISLRTFHVVGYYSVAVITI